MGSEHSGHRARMLSKLERFGPDIFEDHELLEMLLYFCRPRVNTNLLAHELIDRFGSLTEVLNAPSSELEQVEGIGPHSANLLRTVSAIFSKNSRETDAEREIFDTLDKIGRYFSELFSGEDQEKLYAMFVDGQNRHVATVNIATGDISKLEVIPALVINNAKKYKSSHVILAHNHPRGKEPASIDDLNSTLKIRYALSCAGITLAEHFSVGDNGYCPILEKNKVTM